jgi:hypothetical protein
VELDLDGGVGSLVGRQRAGEGEEGFRRQPRGAQALAGGLGDGASPRVEFAEGTLDVITEELARIVQPEPAAAVEQRCAQFVLQPGDGAAQRRLGDVQLVGCPAEVLVPRHHQELPQRVQLHHASRDIPP